MRIRDKVSTVKLKILACHSKLGGRGCTNQEVDGRRTLYSCMSIKDILFSIFLLTLKIAITF